MANRQPLMPPSESGGESAKPALIRSASVLPLFDSVFAVALTLLAFSLPESVMNSMDITRLGLSVGIYLLSGLAVLLYWFKIRRLIQLARLLYASQALIGLACLLVVVLLPRLAQLVVLYGNGTGDIWRWTASQSVNTIFLGSLLLFDALCVLFALSLRQHPALQGSNQTRIHSALRIQLSGFASLLLLGFLELALTSFNSQYVLLVPLILMVEEWLTATRFGTL